MLHARQQFDIASLFAAKTRKLDRVNLSERLAEVGLDMFYASESWPDVAPVRELATKIKSLSGDGFQNPFVFADLRK